MRTVLVSAYAVNPYHGSEDGMGWNFINQIARFNRVIAITRENTRPHIEKFISEHPSEGYSNITFIYYDLPYWMRFWKRGKRGALLYYYLWQLFMPAFIRRQKLNFDIVHNLNFHNDWTPSRLWVLHKPFVWGPIGHHPRIPRNYLIYSYGWPAYILEQIKWWVKKAFWNADPFLKQTVRHADLVLAMNSSVQEVLHLDQEKVVRLPSVSAEHEMYHGKRERSPFIIMMAGRFVPLKGFDIALRSFARFYHQLTEEEQSGIRLILVGDGPLRKWIQALIADLEIWPVVEIIPWMDRFTFKEYYRKAHVFLFPSHEGAGMVVAEALSYGVPVVCFRNYGPGEFVDDSCGITVRYGRYDTSVTHFARALNRLYTDPDLWEKLSVGARNKFDLEFDWNRRGETLQHIYESVMVKSA